MDSMSIISDKILVSQDFDAKLPKTIQKQHIIGRCRVHQLKIRYWNIHLSFEYPNFDVLAKTKKKKSIPTGN